jgi:hypothetical protein
MQCAEDENGNQINNETKGAPTQPIDIIVDRMIDANNEVSKN